MKSLKILGLAVVVTLASACGGSKGKEPTTPTAGGGEKTEAAQQAGTQLVDSAKQKFESALKAMSAHDRAADWNDGACTDMAQQFLQAYKEQISGASDSKGKHFPEALYNAGMSYQRCSKDTEAKAQFQAAVNDDPKFHWGKVQLALYDYKAKGEAALDQTIQALQDAVLEAQFQNVDALVNLAMLEMRRGGDSDWKGCKSDFDCAKINIQRALAIDDGYMPAFNQLALYYLNLAREKAGQAKAQRKGMFAASSKAAQLSSQMLDLAALVCSQAVRKNDKYAPIHNTTGLIQVELKNINSAVGSFNLARRLDPNFFEAQMNYAAVNLSFRGFKQAEDAYRQALKMRPASFEAWLGLALALRGQIDDSNWDQKVKESQEALNKCKELSPDRAETYYNEAILAQEFRAKTGLGEKETVEALEQAAKIFDTFIQKAGAAPEFQDAVKRSNERKADIDKMIKFIKAGEKERKEQEEKDKAAAAAAVTAPGGLEESKEGAPSGSAAPGGSAEPPAPAPAPSGSAQ